MLNVIYGAGDYGRKCYSFLKEIGIEVDFFCQTNDDGRKEFCGRPLKTAEEVLAIRDELSFYIAIFDREQSRNIKEDLLDRTGYETKIYECGELIRLNCTCDEPQKITYQNHNVYEEGVAESYWIPLFSDTGRLNEARRNFIRGLSDDDIGQIDSIIERMKGQPYQDFETDIFTNYEKVKIRRVERKFRPNIVEDPKWGVIQIWNGWRFPIDAGMDPSVWYYKCGLDDLEDTTYTIDKCIIDAGAYIGDSSVILSRYTHSNVYAFEAMRENYLRIDDVCRMNSVNNVVPINLALSDRKGTEKLYITPSHIGNGIVKREAVTYEAQDSVDSTTIDEFVKSRNIEVGLIKADIEGGEPKMLHGAINVIKEQRPILMISIYHTANDFFGIKKIIEDIDSNYKFRIFQPYVRNRVIRDTMLMCEPG